MNRSEMLLRAFDRSAVLQLDNPRYRNFVEDSFALQLRGDLGTTGDLTSRMLLPGTSMGNAIITAKEHGVIAGLAEVKYFFEKNRVTAKALVGDGSSVKNSTAVMELHGDRRSILMLERTAVNTIQRMSGIATFTAKLAQLSKIPIAATRKTLWGLLDKKAVAVGGGLTHRLGVEDAILIKSNHLDMLRESGEADPITVALQRAWKWRGESTFIEIEVRNLAEATTAAKVCAELRMQDPDYPLLIMFDNFSPTAIRGAIATLKKRGMYNAALFEASGGITTERIGKYTIDGLDVLSLGQLTHSAPALNCALRLR